MWRNAPLTARLLSSPAACKRQPMPIPVKINPIWDTEEQARVRFKFTENQASKAPKNMVIRPRQAMKNPHPLSAPKRPKDTTMMPNIPVFVRIPDSRALAGAGATG